MQAKKRKYITFTEQMDEDLSYLMKKEKMARKKVGTNQHYYEKDLIGELLRNERTLKEAWG